MLPIVSRHLSCYQFLASRSAVVSSTRSWEVNPPMLWTWMMVIGALFLGMNLGVVLMGVLAAERHD